MASEEEKVEPETQGKRQDDNVPSKPPFPSSDVAHDDDDMVLSASKYYNITPSLFDEAYEMTQHACFMYCVADLRTMAKEGDLEDGERILQMPVTLGDLIHVMCKNQEKLKDYFPTSYEIYGQWIEEAIEQMEEKGQNDWGKVYMIEFDDVNSKGECVFLLGIDHYKKQVLVLFRGSVTTRDWIADAKVHLVPFPNPANGLKDPPHSLPRNLFLHHGFVEYLFGTEGENSIRKRIDKTMSEKAKKRKKKQADGGEDDDDDAATQDKEEGAAPQATTRKKDKCEWLLQRVQDLFEEYPSYTLHVAGHSLGASLASLFAMEAACAEGVPKPVTCVAVASPKVGNVFFRRTIEYLEASGRLRFLRVSNAADVVTLLPDQGCCYFFFPNRSYHHVGMKVKLYPPVSEGSRMKRAEVTYPRRFGDHLINFRLYQAARNCGRCVVTLIAIPLLCICPCLAGGSALKFHSCKEYSERLQSSHSILAGQSLDECYNRKVKGDLYPEAEGVWSSNAGED